MNCSTLPTPVSSSSNVTVKPSYTAVMAARFCGYARGAGNWSRSVDGSASACSRVMGGSGTVFTVVAPIGRLLQQVGIKVEYQLIARACGFSADGTQPRGVLLVLQAPFVAAAAGKRRCNLE